MVDQGLRTVDEVARELRVSRLTIYRRISSGELPAARIGEHGQLRIRQDAVRELLKPAVTVGAGTGR